LTIAAQSIGFPNDFSRICQKNLCRMVKKLIYTYGFLKSKFFNADELMEGEARSQ
jgi:hypothetical protein